jgi:hypothetical protein
MAEREASRPVGVRDPRIYTLVNDATGRRETGTRYALQARLGLVGSSLSELVHGNLKTHHGYRLDGPPVPVLSRSRKAEPRKGSPFKGPHAKLRPCIRCSGEFHSAHAGHRLCPNCVGPVREAANALG